MFFLKTKKSGYALIYTLIFIVLLLIVVVTTWITGMMDIQMARNSEYSTEAYQMAQMGIESGWTYYKSAIGETYSGNQVDPVPQKTYPDNACSSPSMIRRVDPNTTPTPTETTTALSPVPSTSLTTSGSYDYRICTVAGSPSVTTIEGIGYFKGVKITLKAVVKHDTPANEEYCANGGNDFPTCTAGGGTPSPKVRHPKDYITIYQTGPSS